VQDDAPTNGELAWIDTDEDPGNVIIPEVKDNIVSAQDTWSSQKIKAEIDGRLIIVQTAIAIPAAGSSASYDVDGMTADYRVALWGFSSSAENDSPADLDVDTYAGYFTITNNGGSTAETMQPVFINPTAVTATAR
jgi:hypothetical protein